MPQNYKNHGRLVAPYHFALSVLILVFLCWALWGLIREPGVQSAMGVVLGVSLVLLFWYCRIFPLKVQDRLIRLEMRLRLGQVLPPELQGRILEISPNHLIGLRFAGDAELPDLVQRVLDRDLTSQAEIKQAITDWQADDYRC